MRHELQRRQVRWISARGPWSIWHRGLCRERECEAERMFGHANEGAGRGHQGLEGGVHYVELRRGPGQSDECRVRQFSDEVHGAQRELDDEVRH